MFAEPDLLLHWAHAAGQQPLAVYGVALALLLAVFAAGWWLVRRYHVPHGQSTLPPLVYLAVRLAGGFAAIVVAAWVFTCRIPDDCIDSKRYPLFMARDVMRVLIEQLQAEGATPS